MLIINDVTQLSDVTCEGRFHFSIPFFVWLIKKGYKSVCSHSVHWSCIYLLVNSYSWLYTCVLIMSANVSKFYKFYSLSDIVHPALIVPLLVEFDKNKKSYLFDQSFFDCQVCFLVKQGSKCVQISDCNHVYCRECLSLFIKTKIGDGDVTKIECPSCDSVIQPPLIKDLISTEDFDRFDKLLLQRTLEGMSDIVYCPRLSCGCATVKETDSNMAQCPRCSFCFCVLCRQTWHGIMPCKLLPGDLKILHETWENIDEAERNHLALMYGGRKKLEHAFQELESNKWVQHNAKGCPSCFAKIQKSEGCNKMTCTQCMKYFCWLCDALLPKNDPYSHFRVGAVNRKSSCAGKLFEGIMHYNADW